MWKYPFGLGVQGEGKKFVNEKDGLVDFGVEDVVDVVGRAERST
jgi:hypothetical protein